MKIIRTFLDVFVIIFLLSSCSSSQKSQHKIMSEIYSDVMAYEFSYGSRGYIDYCQDENLYISSATELNYLFSEDDWQGLKNDFFRLEEETWENFLQINTQPIPFSGDLNLGCEYSLIDVRETYPDRSEEPCVKTYYFSQIGFNLNKDQAIVFHGAYCGEFTYGNLYFAELIDGHWMVTEMNQVIIT